MVTSAIIAAALLIGTVVLVKVNHYVFGKVKQTHGNLHMVFFEQIVRVVIIVGGVLLILSSFGGFDSLWKTALGGTAILSGVLAFAGQDVIKDFLAGLMISVNKPFEIGNRVELENGVTGIIRDITVRHVVIQALDTQQIVIPNSKLNEMALRNFSYHSDYRSAHFDFYVGYDTDMEQAMEVIAKAIQDSPYSVPGKKVDGEMRYADIYFMAYEASSLRLATTVYYEATTPSEVLISDVNLRVNKALKANRIEIPYAYVNVIQKEEK